MRTSQTRTVTAGWVVERLILTDDELDALGLLGDALDGDPCPSCGTVDWNSHSWTCETVKS